MRFFFMIFASCVASSQSLNNDVLEKIEENGGNISTAELYDTILPKYPRFAAHLLRQRRERSEMKVENRELRRQLEESNSELKDCICVAHFLGVQLQKMKLLWGDSAWEDKKNTESFYVSANYHNCYQFLNFYPGKNINENIAEKLNSDEPAIKNARETAQRRIEKLPEDKSRKGCNIFHDLNDRNISVHDYCYTLWKAWEIRSGFVHEIDRTLELINKFKVKSNIVRCPKFQFKNLEFDEKDELRLKLNLYHLGFADVFSVKDHVPKVDTC